MGRLKSKLLSLNASKKDKVKVYSPRNCEELRIPFKADKTAKVVGKLAAIPPPLAENVATADQEPQLVTGVLVQNDFKLSLMDPEDLREYAGLTTTMIACKQRLRLGAAGVELVKWALESTFGCTEELPVVDQKMSDAANGTADDSGSHLMASFLVMGCILVQYYDDSEVTLEWEGNILNDGVADAVMAVLLGVESSPAAVKRKLNLVLNVFLARIIFAQLSSRRSSRFSPFTRPGPLDYAPSVKG
jgi:cleavage and polyadenylation specificity factor subunit 3